jgi:hypothetical protein
VRDLEKRVNILNVYLPEPKDLDLAWVQFDNIDAFVARTKEQLIIACEHTVPSLFQDFFSKNVTRGVAIVFFGVGLNLADEDVVVSCILRLA